MTTAATMLAGLVFLVIGESHMLYELHDDIHKDLKTEGAAQVYSYGGCGASAIDWVNARQVDCGSEKKGDQALETFTKGFKTTPINQLIAADKPDVILLIIGDTMGSYDNEVYPRAWAWQGITALTKEIAKTKTACVWVGPPYGNAGGKYNKRDDRVERANRFISKNVSPCSYIDSVKLAEPGKWRTFDGQHFVAEGYAAWSAAIVNELGKIPMIQDLRKEKGQ